MSPGRHRFRKNADPRESTAAQPLYAFGKLPTLRDFVHLNIWNGITRHMQDWIKNGHDHWVGAQSKNRGKMGSFGLLLNFPEYKDQAVVARIWDSRDGTSPPRPFPFCLFMVEPAGSTGDPELLVSASKIWSRMDEWFRLTCEGKMSLVQLRDTHLDRAEPPPDESVLPVTSSLEKTLLTDWLDSLLPQTKCRSRLDILLLLREMMILWRAAQTRDGLAVRLPLNAQMSITDQVSAWMQWMTTNLNSGFSGYRAVIVPGDSSPHRASVVFLARPITVEDFQLLTSEASTYSNVDDLGEISMPMDSSRSLDFESRYRPWLEDRNKTISDWVCCRLD